MPTTKRNNRAGRTFVVDEVVELKRRNRSRTLSIAALLASANASKSVASTSYASSFILTTSGSLRIYDSYEDDDVTPVGYTTVSALVQYIRSSGFYSTVLDIPESAFTWYSADSEEPIAEGVSSYTFTETGSYMVTCKYDYPISTLESLATTDETASLNLTYSFSIVYGTLTLYTRSEAETKSDLLSSLDNLTWSPDESAFDEKDGYLWRKVSSDGGETWTYFRMEYADGVGIVSITQYFALSTSSTIAPTSWATTASIPTSIYPYLWTYSVVTFTDGSTQETTAYVTQTWTAPQTVIIEYQYGSSNTTPPNKYHAHKFGSGIMAFKGLILGDSKNDDWSSTVPTDEIDDYLWMRVSTDGGLTWEYACISGPAGSDASYYYITGDMYYAKSARGVVTDVTTLVFNVALVNYSASGLEYTWAITGDGISAISEDEAAEAAYDVSCTVIYDSLSGDSLTVTIPAGFALDTFTLSVTIGEDGATTSSDVNAIVSSSIVASKLETVDLRTKYYVEDGVTYYASPSNLSHFWDEFPTTLADGVSPIAEGDYVLVWFATYDDDGNYTGAYKTPYIYNGTTWVAYSSTNTEHASILGSVLQEMLTDSDIAPVESALYAFFDTLSANTAWIGFLEATTIHLSSPGGVIYGGGYDSNGENADDTAGFYLDYTGVFKTTSGEFVNITVTGDSSFHGRVENSQFVTVLDGEGTSTATLETEFDADLWSATDAYEAVVAASNDYLHYLVSGTYKYGTDLTSNTSTGTTYAYLTALAESKPTISTSTATGTSVGSFTNSYSYPVFYSVTASGTFYLYCRTYSTGTYDQSVLTCSGSGGTYVFPGQNVYVTSTSSKTFIITISYCDDRPCFYEDWGYNRTSSKATVFTLTVPSYAKYLDLYCIGTATYSDSSGNLITYSGNTYTFSQSVSYSTSGSRTRVDVSSIRGKSLTVYAGDDSYDDSYFDNDGNYWSNTIVVYSAAYNGWNFYAFTSDLSYGTKQLGLVTSSGSSNTLTVYGEDSTSDWHSNVYYNNTISTSATKYTITQKRDYLSAAGFVSSGNCSMLSGNAILAAIIGKTNGLDEDNWSTATAKVSSWSTTYNTSTYFFKLAGVTYYPTSIAATSTGVYLYMSDGSTKFIYFFSQGGFYASASCYLDLIESSPGVKTTNVEPMETNKYALGTSELRYTGAFLNSLDLDGQLQIGGQTLTETKLKALLALLDS